MSNTDTTKNWEYGPGAMEGFYAFLETPKSFIKCHVPGDERRKENCKTVNELVLMVLMGTP